MKTRDDQLLQDFDREFQPPSEVLSLKLSRLDFLHEHKITTYSKLFEMLRDQTASAEIREICAHIVFHLYKCVDRRRAAPALMSALKVSNDALRATTIQALGQIHSRISVPELIKFAANKSESEMVRIYAILAVTSIGDKRAIPLLRQIIFDETENLEIRSVAVEHMNDIDDVNALDDYIALLSHQSTDLRFWTSYALVCSRQDITKALPILDEVVAFDHQLPTAWGWHVDREAIPALERIYYRAFRAEDDPYVTYEVSYLISPAIEYWDFVQTYRQWTETWKYTTLPTPPITLHIEPAWLANKLREHWPDVILNDRQPRPNTYVLDWRLQIDGQWLLGGLHRDLYAVVITAPFKDKIIHQFATWYRSIIPKEEPLFLYEWADPGEAL